MNIITKNTNEKYCEERCPTDIYSKNKKECIQMCIKKIEEDIIDYKSYHIRDNDIEGILNGDITLNSVLQKKYGFTDDETSEYKDIVKQDNKQPLKPFLYKVATRQSIIHNPEKAKYSINKRTIENNNNINYNLKNLIKTLSFKSGGKSKSKTKSKSKSKTKKKNYKKKTKTRRKNKRKRNKRRKTYKKKK